MERLTTRNIAGVAVYKHPLECKRCGDTIWRLPDCGNGSPTEKLADYEDVEEQGLLLRLKCKTGDTVYYRTNNNDIYPIKINEINISNSDVIYNGVIYNGYFMKCTYEFDNSDFGKTVFLTQTEAEQKLKEMEGDCNDKN